MISVRKLFSKVKQVRADQKTHELFSELVRPIKYPEGETEESLYEYLAGFGLDGANGDELKGYLTQDYKRFVYTYGLLPSNGLDQSLLEIGANPYFTSILLKKFTDYQLSFTNYFGIDEGVETQTQRNKSTKEEFEFEYVNHNIDMSDLPFEEPFDVVVFCEVLEHLINDPMQALLRIKKSLKKDGVLILTTPNVNRLENITKMIAGSNIYDPYSGYGIYGRHNREYNKHELFMLLSHCGFEVEEIFTTDVHDNHSNDFFPIESIAKNISCVKNREYDLGQYIFVRAKNTLEAKPCMPKWLYRSYPESKLCDDC